MKVKKESEKADSKLNIQEAKIMASGPITSQQIGDETTETVTYFPPPWVPQSLKIMTAAMKLKDPCSLEENLDRILKSISIALQKNVGIMKAIVFPVIMYGCELDNIEN